MTREENMAKLDELRSEAETLCKEYNEAVQNQQFEEAFKKGSALVEKINEHTSVARTICFEECKASPNPMIAAVTKLHFSTIAIKDSKTDDNKTPVRSIVDKERPVDLFKLHKYCSGIGADKYWLDIATKMNFLLTAQKCVDLGIDPKSVSDSYSMSEIARNFDMGKNPTSKTNLLKTLQAVVTAMLGNGYKATSHDVNYLLSVYAPKSHKALTVTCARHHHFRIYLAEICHRIVTPGATYKAEYPAKKR